MIYRTTRQFDRMIEDGWEVLYTVSQTEYEIRNRETEEVVQVSVEENIS